MRRALFILGELADRDVVWLATVGKRLSVASGETIIHAGEAMDTLYLVIDGRMAVTMGDGARLAELGPGDIIGEMSLIERRPPAVDVSALSTCQLLGVAHDVLRAELARNDALAARFYHALAVFLSDRLRGTVARLGYGAELESDRAAQLLEDNELDEAVLDTVSLAGDRFRRLIELVEQ